jgi:hypothetical protein
LPLFAEVDMSGVSMRVGIRLFNFGFWFYKTIDKERFLRWK